MEIKAQFDSFISKLKQVPHRKLLISFSLLGLLGILVLLGVYYYLWKERKNEFGFFDSNTAYQEGAFLYSKMESRTGAGGVPIAIRGKVVGINGWFLTIENSRQKLVVEIEKDFEFVNITERPADVSEEVEELTQEGIKELYQGETKTEGIDEEGVKELVKRGLVVIPEESGSDNLSQLINIGDVVVISGLRTEETDEIKGSFLSILSYLR